MAAAALLTLGLPACSSSSDQKETASSSTTGTTPPSTAGTPRALVASLPEGCDGVTYGDMAYHPSGLAIGFVVTDAASNQLYLSTNQGQDAKLLVDAPPGTTFGHLVFAHDGKALYYGIDRKDASHSLAAYGLADGGVKPVWSGDAPIGNVVELGGVPGLALTVGTPCANRRAVFSTLDGSAGRPLSVGIDGPTAPPSPTT